jgi:hypothetical protein
MSSGAMAFHRRGGSSAPRRLIRGQRPPESNLSHRCFTGEGAYQDGSYQDMSRPPTIGDRRTAAPGFASRLSKLSSASCSLCPSSGTRPSTGHTRASCSAARQKPNRLTPRGRLARDLRRPPRRGRIKRSGSVTASFSSACGRCRAGNRRRPSGENVAAVMCKDRAKRAASNLDPGGP